MQKSIEKDEIIELINKGYKLKLISLEFDIPMQTLERIQDEIERKETLAILNNPKQKEILNQIAEMRENYRREYYKKDYFSDIISKEKSQTEEEVKQVNEVIEKNNKIVDKIQSYVDSDKSNTEKIHKIQFLLEKILSNVGTISYLELTPAQAQKIQPTIDYLKTYKFNQSNISKRTIKKLTHILQTITKTQTKTQKNTLLTTYTQPNTIKLTNNFNNINSNNSSNNENSNSNSMTTNIQPSTNIENKNSNLITTTNQSSINIENKNSNLITTTNQSSINIENKNSNSITTNNYFSTNVENLNSNSSAINNKNSINNFEAQKLVETLELALAQNLAKQIANDTLDIDKAKSNIDIEIKKILEAKSNIKQIKVIKRQIGTPEEKEKNQILYYVRKYIAEKSESYPVKNPDRAIKQIYLLSNKNSIEEASQNLDLNLLEKSIISVVTNLSNNNKHEKAQNICSNIQNKIKDQNFQQTIINLKTEITKSKIKHYAQNLLTNKGTLKDQITWYTYIQNNKKSLQTITLGPTKYTPTQINLHQILPETSLHR
jgi:hypothetical protein